MDSSYLIGFEMAFVFFGVIGFGLWELHKLRRMKREKAPRDADGHNAPGA